MTDATDSTDSQESRKKARDPVSQYLKSRKRGRGPGFLSLLALLFIGLKLTGHVGWSWFWVLSPIWIKASFALMLVALAIFIHKKTGWEPSGET